MSKGYLCQLAGGKMLVFQNGWVGVETVGYPLPDCSLVVGDYKYRGQCDVLRAVLGYDVADMAAFARAVAVLEPMQYSDFKKKVILGDIGGGCPERLRKATLDTSLGFNQAMFKYILPEFMLDAGCLMPSEEDMESEYGDLLGVDWAVTYNEPNWRFRNNILLFTGCGEVNDRVLSFIEDLEAICLSGVERAKYKYISGITLSNGKGAVILTDSYAGNSDVCFLYQRVTGCDLSEGQIVCEVDKSGVVEAHFTGRRKCPVLRGRVERKVLQ